MMPIRSKYDVAKVGVPMREWLPVWWEHQFRYEKMFLGAMAVSAVLQMVILFMRIMRKQKLRPQYVGVFMKQSLREPY